MTKEEAIALMRSDSRIKVRHTSFLKDEFICMPNHETIQLTEGYQVSLERFFEYRVDKAWEQGWIQVETKKEMSADAQMMENAFIAAKKCLPDEVGAALFVFPINKNEGVANYISDCEREDMIKFLRRSADSLEAGLDFNTPNSN